MSIPSGLSRSPRSSRAARATSLAARILTRRDWLARTGVAAAGLATSLAGRTFSPGAEPPLAAAAQQEANLPVAAGDVDAHVHIWTPDTERYPLAAGFRREEMRPASFTADELLALARPCGVSRVVLIQMSFYGFDNRYLLDAIRDYPGVFSGVAVIDDEAARPQDEMLRLKRQGVRGFRIYPRNRPLDRWLAGEGMQAMWRTGAAEGLAMCHLVNPDALPAIDRMCERFPDTPVVIDHFARIGIDGQFREADVANLCRLARHRSTYVKLSAFYALGAKRPPYDDLVPIIRRLVESFGPERLMWATDCPFQVVEQRYEDSLALVRDRLDFLSTDQRRWLLRGTATKVFFH